MFSFIPNAEIQSPDTSIFAVHHHHHHRRQPHMMKLQFRPLILPHPKTNPKPRLRSTKISCKKYYDPGSRNYFPPFIPPSTPPRDVEIDFGTYKGQMLGSLPSTYLKWISKNLKYDHLFESWAKLADKVLEDPVYKDRIEWEYADKNGWDFEDLAERFGWDFGPFAKWRGINYKLLGTSFGGRIPRIDPNRPVEREFPPKREKPPRAAAAAGGEVSAREKRRERMRSKSSERSSEGRLKLATAGYANGGDDAGGKGDQDPTVEVVQKKGFPGRDDFGANRTAEDVHKRFPGRESLLKRVIDRNKLLQ